MTLLTAEEWQIVALSLKVSSVAILAVLPIAFGLAWLLARGRFPGKILLDAAVHLPLVLPPVVTGWLLLLAFGNNGPAGRWLAETLGLTFMFRWTGAALAAAVMALPLMVRAMRLSLEAVDRRLEGAARTLGAPQWRLALKAASLQKKPHLTGCGFLRPSRLFIRLRRHAQVGFDFAVAFRKLLF